MANINQAPARTLAAINRSENLGSTLKRFFKEQQINFLDVITQMSKGDFLTLPNSAPIDMKTNSLGAALAVNKWLADQESTNAQLLKIFSFQQKLADQLNSIVS